MHWVTIQINKKNPAEWQDGKSRNKFMASDLSNVYDTMPIQGMAVSTFLITHFHFESCFCKDTRYLFEVFQNIWLKKIWMLYIIYKLTSQRWSTWGGKAFPTFKITHKDILSGLGDIVSSLFGGGSSGGYKRATTDKIKKNFYTLKENQLLKTDSKWMIELGSQQGLLQNLHLTLQCNSYAEKVTYLEISKNMLILWADVNSRLTLIRNGIKDIHIDVDKVNTYLEALANQIETPVLIPLNAERNTD